MRVDQQQLPWRAAADPVGAFATLVWEVTHFTPSPAAASLGDHLTLLSNHCGLRDGATFDYLLPVEEWHVWYRAFVAVLGLDQVMASGWNVQTRDWKARNGSDCFYHLPGYACDGTALPQERASVGHSNHATGSDKLLERYYTPELAALVTTWAHADLTAFGYKAWDGTDAESYLAQPRVQKKR